MQLREVAVEAALADPKDDGAVRQGRAAHQGADRRGDARATRAWATCSRGRSTWSGRAWTRRRGPRGGARPPAPAQPELLAGALKHLKVAATQLPDVAEAQALLGVALVLSQEQGLGRQYLQKAMRLGNLDPQYQIWAAWSMVQAGYPEEAEPIVARLLEQVAAGPAAAGAGGDAPAARRRDPPGPARPRTTSSGPWPNTTRRSPAARSPPAVQLRLAQIDVQLGEAPAAVEADRGAADRRARGARRPSTWPS